MVYEAQFDAAFLAVPQECLILSMKQHQKYFPLLDAQSRQAAQPLPDRQQPRDRQPQEHHAGNERVLRARLSDAKFFFDQDRKTRLADRVERLGTVVYHNKLGSQLERVQRIAEAGRRHRAEARTPTWRRPSARPGWRRRTCSPTWWASSPSCRALMGQYYALHDGEDTAVARAIEAHYHPRFAGDTLPEDNIGCAVALADKLDTLVGIYGIGLAPTGDKDPFGLRRQALGVLRILSEKSLPLDLA